MSELNTAAQTVLPVLALRGMVVFPQQTTHFDVGRVKSARSLEESLKKDQLLYLAPQRDITVEDPDIQDFYPVGTVAQVKQILRSQGENIRVLVTGLYRASLQEVIQREPYIAGVTQRIEDTPAEDDLHSRALRREALGLYANYLEMVERPSHTTQLRMIASDSCGFLADTIAQNSGIDYPDKATLLCMLDPVRRLEYTLQLLRQEVQLLQLEAEIQDKTRAVLDQHQRDYYLREQIKVMREELGEGDEDSDLEEYDAKIRKLHLEEETEKKLLKDLDHLKKQPYGSSEGAVLRNYLDTVLDLPWNTATKERLDIAAAERILNRDHYGMEKVKQRILETLAVRKMAPEMPPQILCLVGPPGVGKTSIAYSIAKSLNRKMARISLGGVRDEADIRGHRKTYVGAMPGRIMSAMIQAGSRNPVLLLDEVDKMGSDYRGDPSAALLEVLDSEQNQAYRDHYLEVPFDLRDVLFITTANTLDTVPRPLLDRMEVIELNSYTDEEKLQIAKNHLIPKQLQKHGLKKSQLRFTDDAIREIIRCYTRESGVRNLERAVSQVCRKADKQLLDDPESKKVTVNGGNVEVFLGVRKFLPDRLPGTDQVGLVTGLAWTAVGGETLEVEVNVMDGSGKLELTGNLGDVMKESAHAALSYIRANSAKLGIAADFYKTKDIHVHFPEGAVPKDGPSAGVTVCTAMVSALTGLTVRRDVAMTGEISIRGRVLPIGGLKEKTMAALRHGVNTVIIPQANERDLEEIDQTVRKSLKFITAQTVETVLEAALNRHKELKPALLGEIPDSVKPKARKPEIRQ
ncbi:MAG TPA: endopeptidase La [Candidatus Faecousia intestinigallinarum]|nr:endopeptidase La [Candidatus Faecousia intestinigallinarum]